MSSIYRKTRDGYYYYQTYIYNPESKKKDKRIFHALATKDKKKAKEKQLMFDKKYETLVKPNTSNKFSNFIKSNKKTFLTIFISSFITYYLTIIFKGKQKHASYNANQFPNDSLIINKIEELDLSKKKIVEQVTIQLSNREVLGEKISTKGEKNEPVSLPNYEILRIEQLSQAFDQGKLFVVTDSLTEANVLRKLCVKISEDYSNFENIVICIYSDDKIGRKIALGNTDDFTFVEKRKSWLVMYTYNPVEGPFFDDNPSEYLW